MRINAIVAAALIALIPLAASAGEIRNPVHNAAYHRIESRQQQMHARHKHHRHARHMRHAHPATTR